MGSSVMKNGEWYLEGSPFSITEALVPRVELNEISMVFKKYLCYSRKS